MQHVVPCHPTRYALGLAQQLVREVIPLHRLPATMVSDWGPQFASDISGPLSSWHGIIVSMFMAYLQQSDWQTDRTNTSMEKYLRVFVHDQCVNCISKKYCRPGAMAPSEWTRSVRAVRNTGVADNTAPGVNSMGRVPYYPLIAVSPILLVLSVSYFKRSLWHCA